MEASAYTADGMLAKEIEDELMKYTKNYDHKVEANLAMKTNEVQTNSDVEVNITECTKSLGNELVAAEFQDTTENSSSFDDCNSGNEDVDTFGDSEASSDFHGDAASAQDSDRFGERSRMRRKKLTTQWRSFIQPLMWRCKWAELQIKKLQSQAQLYDRKIETYNAKKRTQLDNSTMVDGTKSLPFSSKNAKNDIFKRRKRRRTEATIDVAAYMSHHNLFSCFENRKCLTEGAFMNNEVKNLANQKIISDHELGNDELLSFELGDGDKSLGQILSKIDFLQSEVGKLQSKLNRITTALSRLTVFNAGKNKLTSMNEVKSLSSLRALILNDNEISSVCKLDQMTELNTLVLSRNPISSLGESLAKLQSITKLSLSNCRLQKVDSSLRSCLELKELRLAHNEIMTIPIEFGNFVKLQNLDLGNNLIASWSNMKVLSSLVNMTNLNLQGNPIAEKEKLLKKVKKLLPNLHIFNARPIDKIAAKEVPEKAIDFSIESGDRLNRRSETKIDHPMRNNNSSKANSLSESMDYQPTSSGDLGFKNKRKELHDEQGIHDAEITNISGKRKKKNSKLQQDTPSELGVKSDNVGKGKDVGKKSSKLTKEGRVNVIDSAETLFVDPFVTEDPVEAADKKLDRKMVQATDGVKMVVTYPTKKKNKKNHAVNPLVLEASQVGEIGLGGTSAWDP